MNIDRISKLGLCALASAEAVYHSLGEFGKTRVSKLPFNDYQKVSMSSNHESQGNAQRFVNADDASRHSLSILADIEAEAAILNIIRVNRLNAHVYGEEFPDTVFNQGNEFTFFCDGLDGTSSYLEKGPDVGRQAIMFGIFQGENPSFKDYLFSGVMEPATGKTFYAVKGQGAHLMQRGRLERIKSSGDAEITSNSGINLDEVFDKWAGINVIENSFIRHLRRRGIKYCVPDSSAAVYVDVANGQNVLGFESTRAHRKRNLETITAYGLLKESGGLIADGDGNEIGSRSTLSYGQGQNEYLPIIVAANERILDQFLKLRK